MCQMNALNLFYSGGLGDKDLNRYVKIPIPQPPAMPKSRNPRPKHMSCSRYCHVLTSACIRWAYTNMDTLANMQAIKPSTKLSRSKLFGLPFHAAYPIPTAIAGTPTKRANKNSPSTTCNPICEPMVTEAYRTNTQLLQALIDTLSLMMACKASTAELIRH